MALWYCFLHVVRGINGSGYVGRRYSSRVPTSLTFLPAYDVCLQWRTRLLPICNYLLAMSPDAWQPRILRYGCLASRRDMTLYGGMYVPTVGAPSTVPPIFGSMPPSIVVLLLHLCDMSILYMAFRILVWTVLDDIRDGSTWTPPGLGPLYDIFALYVTGPILL